MVYDNDKMKEYNKEYKEKYRSNPENRAKELAYWRTRGAEKVQCENCGATISKRNISEHKKTKKCMKHNE